MKKTDLEQIKELDVKSLAQKVKDLKKELGDLSVDKNMNKLNDLKAIVKKRRDLAQIATIIRQKELLLELEEKVSKRNAPLKKGEAK